MGMLVASASVVEVNDVSRLNFTEKKTSFDEIILDNDASPPQCIIETIMYNRRAENNTGVKRNTKSAFW